MVSIDLKRTPIVITGKQRGVFLRIRNLQNFEAEGLSVVVYLPLGGTNVTFNAPWQGPELQFTNSNGGWDSWRVMLDFPSTAHSIYTPPTFYLNVTNDLVLVRVEVKAQGRNVQRYFALLN